MGINGLVRRRGLLRSCYLSITFLTMVFIIGISQPRADTDSLIPRRHSEVCLPEYLWQIPAESPVQYLARKPVYFELSDKESNLVARQIAIEAEGAPLETKQLVAQCILDRIETMICSDGTVEGTINWPNQFSYRDNYTITDDAWSAIESVFYSGVRVTDERAIFFCNPNRVSKRTLKWFESFVKVAESGNMYFFSAEKVSR